MVDKSYQALVNQKLSGDKSLLQYGRPTETYNWYAGAYEDSQTAFSAIVDMLTAEDEKQLILDLIKYKTYVLKRLTSHHWAVADQINLNQPVRLEIKIKLKKELFSIVNKAKEETSSNVYEFQPISEEKKLANIIGELDQKIDQVTTEIVNNSKACPFDFISWASSRKLTKEQCLKLIEHYKPQAKELLQLIQGEIEGSLPYSKKVAARVLNNVYLPIITQGKQVSTRKKKVTKLSKMSDQQKADYKERRKKRVSNTLAVVNNKQVAVLYSQEYGQLFVLKSLSDHPEDRLYLDKCVIRNVDQDKSYMIRIGKNNDVIREIKRKSFQQIESYVKMLGLSLNRATGRVSDHHELILTE